MSNFRDTITITFGDQAVSHIGMQKIGHPSTAGLTLDDLYTAQHWFWNHGIDCVIYDIGLGCLQAEENRSATPAYFLVARRGLNAILWNTPHPEANVSQIESQTLRTQATADDFYQEHQALDPDKKVLMYGEIKNKQARWNLCFGDYAQEPDYANKRGRVVAFDTMPLLNCVRQRLPTIVGDKVRNLVVEANYYYDPTKCGIGFHGDTERQIVVGLRLGQSMPIQFQWHLQHQPVGERAHLILNHGDVYMMSEKTVGSDWKFSHLLTLRHAAGAPKYLK
jgi:alkylated DNA repair dioxygenase AlkB